MKAYYLTLVMFVSSLGLMAQPDGPPPDFERVEAYKTKFITDKLDLSPEEAQLFWPVYNEYSKKLKEIHMRRYNGMSKRDIQKDWDRISDEDLKQIALQELQNQKDIADLKLQYFSKFEEVVGTRKAAGFYRLEIEFHRHLMETLGKRRKKRP